MKTKPSLLVIVIIAILLIGISILGTGLYLCNKQHQIFGIVSQNNIVRPKQNIVRVGAILPMTGPTAYLGEGEALGSRLALESQTVDAPIKVEFVFEDSQGKADLAISAVRKLLDVQDIRLHVVSTTTPVLATLPVYRDSGKDVLVIAQCMMPKVLEGFPFAYRLYATSDEETDLLADYANKRGLKKFAALHISNRWGEEGIRFFGEKVSSFGGNLALKEEFSFADKDFRTILSKIKKLKVDGVIIYAYSTTFPIIFQQMQELRINVPVLGNLDLALGGVENKISRDFLKKVVFPAPQYYFDSHNPRVQEFNNKVKALGKEPNIDIAYFYDMTKVLMSAIQKAGSADPSKIGETITSLMPFEGVTGKLHLNEQHDTRADMKLVRWGDQGIELVQDEPNTQKTNRRTSLKIK